MFSVVPLNIYNTFFYSSSTHLLHQQLDEVLFGCFVTTLNAAFESKLVLEDKRYESGSENFDIPTPLRRTSRIYISSDENISFDSATPHSQPVMLQTCMVLINLQYLWWWGHLYSWHSITFQHNTIAEPHGFSTAATFQVHPNHMWWLKWRRRGFSNSFIRRWPLEYVRNSG